MRVEFCLLILFCSFGEKYRRPVIFRSQDWQRWVTDGAWKYIVRQAGRINLWATWHRVLWGTALRKQALIDHSPSEAHSPAAFKGAACISDKLGHVAVVTGGSGSGKFKLAKVHVCCTLCMKEGIWGRFVTLYAFDHLKVLFGVCTVANNILNNFLHGLPFNENRLNSGCLYRKRVWAVG